MTEDNLSNSYHDLGKMHRKNGNWAEIWTLHKYPPAIKTTVGRII